MFAIDRLRTDLAALPRLAQVGLALIAVAGFGDVVAHLQPAGGHVGHAHDHTAAEVQAHVAGFVGMVVVFAGVVIDGAFKHRVRRQAEPTTKGVA